MVHQTLTVGDNIATSKDTTEKRMRVAVVGCGAVAELRHLPHLTERTDVDVTLLVDRDLARANQLASKFGVPNVSIEINDVAKYADAAIVAVPHKLHASVSLQLLEKQVHVFVEKPMAFTAAECDEMIAMAARENVTLAVGLMRRFKWSVQFASRFLESGMIGDLRNVDAREGGEFTWPIKSSAAFSVTESGGGVLADVGSHTLDVVVQVCGVPEEIKCRDNAAGGVETESVIQLKWPNGVEGEIVLSRTRTLRNTVVLTGTLGTIEFGLKDNLVRISCQGNESIVCSGEAVDESSSLTVQNDSTLFPPQIDEWLDAINEQRTPKVCGAIGRKSVALIESCYLNRKPLSFPWHDFACGSDQFDSAIESLKGKKVLITGGTGFIGARLAEVLRQSGISTRVFYRNHSRLARVARFGDIDFAHGDLTNAEEVSRALDDIDVVMHLAHAFVADQVKKTTEAAKNLIAACKQRGVSRLVYASSMAVYGDVAEGVVGETAPHRAGDPYSRAKFNAQSELLTQSDKHGLECIVLQPTIVYGPFSKTWTVTPAREMQDKLIAVPNCGVGISNCVYIDDVVQSLVLAAATENPDAIGKEFLISGPEPVTWKEFYGAIESALNVSGIYACSLSEAYKNASSGTPSLKQMAMTLMKNKEFWDQISRFRFAHRVANLVNTFSKANVKFQIREFAGDSRNNTKPRDDNKPISFPARERARLLASTAKFSTDRAQSILKYSPQFSFERGSAITTEFIRWYFDQHE